MARDLADLKSMPLYRDVDRIYKELRAAGLDDRANLSVEDLVPFDQYHYHGTAALDVAIETLGIGSETTVLEIGSGIGGPARYIAATTGAQVTALELQADLNEIAKDLTTRCGLAGRVEHVCVDALEFQADRKFDVIVSWLAFFHIEDRSELLKRCIGWLGHSGRIFVEDLYARGPLTAAEKEDLDELLYSRYLPDRAQYAADFQAAGFADLQVIDMSGDWQQFTHERYAEFCQARRQHEAVHGRATVEGLDQFYGTVARLFAGGNLGGLRVWGRRPPGPKR
jgi:cyclopropane fatty-acyl-phospholipid synthase-like methyltransferase